MVTVYEIHYSNFGRSLEDYVRRTFEMERVKSLTKPLYFLQARNTYKIVIYCYNLTNTITIFLKHKFGFSILILSS